MSIHTETKDDLAGEVWWLWCWLTRRDDKAQIPDAVFDTLTEVQTREDGAMILRIVDGAARMGVGKDTSDTGRLVRALTRKGTRTRALKAHDKGARYKPAPARLRHTSRKHHRATSGHDRQPQHHKATPDTSINDSMVDTIASHMGTSNTWTAFDWSCAQVLADVLQPSDVYATTETTPGDLMRRLLDARDKAPEWSRQPEKADLSSVRFDVDPDAMSLLVRGVDEHVVAQFHHSAPEGYWDRVAQMVTADPSETLLGVYDALQPEFDWHPIDRRAV